METVTLPEQYSERIKTIAGYPIRVTSYRLWDTFYAKTEVALDGMGGWFAGAEGSTQAGAEASVAEPSLSSPIQTEKPRSCERKLDNAWRIRNPGNTSLRT